MPDNPVIEVWARGKSGTIRKAGFDCDDVTYAVMTLADGALAPNARLRAAIVPGPLEKPGDDAAHHAHEAPARMGWARLLKRVFDIDLEHCPQCGGTLKIIAVIEEPAVIVRILTHLGLPARAPARPLSLFQAA